MNVDIANILSTLLEQMQKTDWIQHIITCFSVFIGAFLAYRFNMSIERRKFKRQMQGEFCSLATQLHLNLNDLITYKEGFLNKILKVYEEQNIKGFLSSISGPTVSFTFDTEKYIFLNDCNRCFIPEIKTVQSTYEFLQKRWVFYTEELSRVCQLRKEGNIDSISQVKKIFMENCELYDKLCIRLYYLNKHFNRCYERFFNVNYYDDLEEDFKSEEKLIKSIPNALTDEEFIKLDEYFDKYWAPDHTLWEDIKYHYRKLKYHLKGLKIYFFGRGNSKTKRKSKGKK